MINQEDNCRIRIVYLVLFFHKHIKIYFMIRKQSLASCSSVSIVVGHPLAEMVRLVIMALLKIMEVGSTVLIQHG